MMSLIRIGLVCLTATAALLSASPASAQLRPLSEKELSATYGQGLLDLSNSSFIYNNETFYSTRLAIGADVLLNANFGKINLGAQTSGGITDWSNSDIDMPLLQFGSVYSATDKRAVQITNPYFEFIYKNAPDAATREVVGMRMGFEGIKGDIGLMINTLSGSMVIDGKDYTGYRMTGSAVPAVPGVTAGDASGASRDFWISALKTAVQFPTAPGMTVQSPAAQQGFWLNWRDKLTALSATPPNAFKR